MADFDGRQPSKREVFGLTLLSFGGLLGLESMIDMVRDISRNEEISKGNIVYSAILVTTTYVGARIYAKAMKRIKENDDNYRERQFDNYIK